MNNNIEIRSFTISEADESRHITGYSVVFNELSRDLGGFREIISPSAITRELIERSDVVMNYAHDDNLILARSNNGVGTLKLSLDDHGLQFDFDMPNSPIGDQVLESIRRGDITTCSFAFTLDPDNERCETWERDDTNGIVRTINEISGLYDCAIVTHAAYPTTSVSARSLEKINELNNMTKEDIELREDEKSEDIKDEELQDKEEQKSEDEKPEDLEQKSSEEDEDKEDKEDTNSDDEQSDDEQSEDEQSDEKPEDKEKEEQKSYKNKSHNIMEKRFSLLKSIRDIANGNKLDDASQAVVNAGAEEMRKAGQSFSGQIQLPVAEMRDPDEPVHYTVEADGEHVVVTDYLNILEPLKSKNVLVNAGANYLTGCKGNIQIPSMSAENVFWEGEIDETENGAGSFSHINMAPRRLSAYVDISKQFLVQDTLGAENLIRKLLVEAINDKLEATILSDAAEDGAKPAGIFYNVTPTDIKDFNDVCEFESELDENNFVGDFKYVINPKAKAYLRSTIKGTNATGMIMENDAIDGTPCETTTHMDTDTLAYGNWSDLYIAQFGGVDLLIDNYTQATKGCVRLVINAFFDYKVVRNGAIVLGKISRE